jgi:hypothetical protein
MRKCWSIWNKRLKSLYKSDRKANRSEQVVKELEVSKSLWKLWHRAESWGAVEGVVCTLMGRSGNLFVCFKWTNTNKTWCLLDIERGESQVAARWLELSIWKPCNQKLVWWLHWVTNCTQSRQPGGFDSANLLCWCPFFMLFYLKLFLLGGGWGKALSMQACIEEVYLNSTNLLFSQQERNMSLCFYTQWLHSIEMTNLIFIIIYYCRFSQDLPGFR